MANDNPIKKAVLQIAKEFNVSNEETALAMIEVDIKEFLNKNETKEVKELKARVKELEEALAKEKKRSNDLIEFAKEISDAYQDIHKGKIPRLAKVFLTELEKKDPKLLTENEKQIVKAFRKE